jgi:amino acid adenylation domain-containing protein
MGNKKIPEDSEDFFPLSDIQKGMIYYSLLDPTGLLYVNQNRYQLVFREFDEKIFKKTFELMVEKHPMLRTSFNMYDFEEPIQIVHKNITPDIQHHDISSLHNPKQNECLKKLILEDRQKPFNITTAEPLWRIKTVALGNDNLCIIWSCHHAIIDGWSFAALMTEVENTYSRLKQYPGFKPEKLRNTYKKYVIEELTEKKKSKSIDFWKKELEGYLRIDFPVTPLNINDHKINEEITVSRNLTDELARKLNNTAKKYNTCLKHLCFGAYVYMLNMLSYENDVVGGIVTNNRPTCPDGEKIIGCFLNTIPVRVKIPPMLRWKDYILLIEKKLLELKKYDSLSFFEIVRVIGEVTQEQNPIFDTIFNFTDYHIYNQMNLKHEKADNTRNNGVKLPAERKRDTNTLFDCDVSTTNNEFVVSLSCSGALVSSEKAFALCGYFEKILYKFVKEAEIIVIKEELISDEEKQRILIDFNNTRAEYTPNETIHELFTQQVEKTPDHTAVIGPSAREVGSDASPAQFIQITYSQLNKESHQLAQSLRKKGVHSLTNPIVAIMVERSIDMIIGILGVLKAGGAYLPIDPGYPPERIDYMLKDSNAKILLTAPPDQVEIKVTEKSIEMIDISKGFSYSTLTLTSRKINSANLAYVIYTSGSSGKPKGVLVEQGNLTAYLFAFFQEFNIQFTHTAIQLGSYTFDAFIEEVFPVLLRGGKLIIPGQSRLMDMDLLSRSIINHHVNIINCTPLLLSEFNKFCSTDRECKPLKRVQTFISGGDALRREYVDNLLDIGTVYNTYGPTETTVCASYYRYCPGDNQSAVSPGIPIGKPICNYRILILAKFNQLQSMGAPGEICISGDGVTKGYLNNPELTAEKFTYYYLLSTQSAGPLRIYRTGDLARWLPDGNIEFLGRIDRQVKVRGYRIELGEIESQLLKYEKIKEAVAKVNDGPRNNNDGFESRGDCICVYFVADSLVNISELKKYLSTNLPYYMEPAFYKQIEKIPLTPSGKVDPKALPLPEVKEEGGYIGPGNELEESLVEIWSEVLGIDKNIIGIDANFFALGGHSLKVIALVARIHKKLKLKIKIAEIFKRPRVRELAGYLKEAAKDKYKSIESAEQKEYYSLSSAQKRIYILQQIEVGSTVYNMPEFIPLAREYDPGKIENTIKTLIKRHESLRTSFYMIDEEPVQRIHDEVEFEVEYYDLATEDTEGTGKKEEIHNSKFIIQNSFICSFDLSHAPLLRIMLVKTTEAQHLLLVDMHHIISDGVSHEILVKDFMTLSEGEELPPLQIQYKDFSQWQGSEKEKENTRRQEEYWLKGFTGKIPVLNLPTDFLRPAIQSFEGGEVCFEIRGEESAALKKLSLNAGATLFMVLLGVVNVLLAKLSSQEDVIVGTPTAGRRHADLEKIIGMFVNTLALRNYPFGEQTFREFIYDIKKRTLEAFENQEYPFEDLVERVAVNRDAGRNPLFDIMFVLHNVERIPGVRVKNKTINQSVQNFSPGDENIVQVAKFDLTLTAVEVDRSLLFIFQYCTKLFTRETINRFSDYFKEIVSTIAKEPDKRLSQIEIIEEGEKKQLLHDFNKTESTYPRDRLIHQLFQEQAEKTPESVAVIGVEHRAESRKQIVGTRFIVSVTYQELNRKSNRLAHFLREKGVGPDTVVGIKVKRSIEMIIGILGILKAGGAYLPIDPEYPRERVSFMLSDSGATVLLSEGSELSKVSGGTEVIDLPLSIVENEDAGPTQLTHPTHSTHLCYIIYTSGSTGRPKAVMIEHCPVVNILFALFKYYPFSEKDTYLFKTPYIFDVSVTELFGWFFSGGRLAVLENGAEKDPQKISDAVEGLSVTHINFVPSMFSVFVDWLSSQPVWQLSSLKYIFLAGEALLPVTVNKFREIDNKIQLENIYGPTESTIYATRYPLDAWDGVGSIPIGYPLTNIKTYILDSYSCLQPIGIAGELWLAGAGLSRGYLNRPEPTAEKFRRAVIRHSSLVIGSFYRSQETNDRCLMTNDRLYRTGDLARWLFQDNIEFLGRIDHQVKIRGFRIELGEIENQLLKHNEIKEVVVCSEEDSGVTPTESGDKYLCAYIVGSRVDAAELSEYLSQSLPDYMIPMYFMEITHIPLTLNGKVDRKSLPAPGLSTKTQYTAPRTIIEVKLWQIWMEVLFDRGKDAGHMFIGIDDNFFKLGGHSLNAIVMIAKIHKELNVKVPLAEVFKTPTIRGLSRYIKRGAIVKYAAIEPAEKKEYYVLSSAQKRLYILQQMELNSTAYNMPEIIPLPEELNVGKLEKFFKNLIHRHESMQTSFHMINEEPVQVIHDEVEFEVEYYNLATEGTGKKEIHNSRFIIQNSFIRPFDLSHSPLLRIGLAKTPGGQHLLLVDMHHIISDGVSHEILIKDFMVLHEGRDLPLLRIQYKDFSQWQNSEKETEKLKHQETFWLKEFEGEIPLLNLPGDYPRPAVQTFEGSMVNFEISREEIAALKQISLEQGVTLFMVLLGVYNVLISKLSGQEDIVIGSPIAGRGHPDLEKIIGMFVNTLALRNYPSGKKTFQKFLREVKEYTLEAFENQEYQFEDLVDRVAVRRDAARNPLFDIMFTFNRIAGHPGDPDNDIARKEISPGTKENREYGHYDGDYDYEYRESKFDMTLTAVESVQNLFLSFTYNTALFEEGTIKRFVAYFKNIVSTIISAEKLNIKLSQIEMMPEEEKKQILYDFNSTDVDYPDNKTIHQLFAEQTWRIPDHVVAVHTGQGITDSHALTYRELNKRASQLARRLVEKGCAAGSIVALMIEPSPEMIAAILAVLKTGSCFLPIDPLNPKERSQYLLTDSETKLLLTYPLQVYSMDFKGETLNIEDKNLYKEEVGEIPETAGPNFPVYMIYTSGTTGEPKGVLLKHENLVNYVCWFSTETCLTGEDKSALTSSFAFDLGYTAIFPALLSGAQLHILPKETYMLPENLLEYIYHQGISYLKITPSLFSPFINSPLFSMDTCRSLRLVVLGGEAIDTTDVEIAFHVCPHLQIMNHYGPTEVTIGCIAQFIDRDGLAAYKTRPTIGKPIFNTKAYILDKDFNLLPVGLTGELFLSGAGIAKGYFKRDALTSEKFIKNPFMGLEKTPPLYDRIYRTGDLARWLPDGNIEFLGRRDHQIKIRGYRVELGEIENRLLDHKEVKEVIVVVGTNETGIKYLCAYIVPHHPPAHEPEASISKLLKEFLSHSLPDYMIPSYFIQLEKLPLTPNGKVDRKALPTPQIKAGSSYTAPRDKLEEMLVEIWTETLYRNALPDSQRESHTFIGIDDDFFELGGHSLKATIMASKIYKELQVKLPLVEVFKTPTIRRLAEYIKNARNHSLMTVPDNLVLLKKKSDTALNIFFIHDGTGEVVGYVDFCRHLTSDLNYWGIRADKLASLAPQTWTIEQLAQNYVEKIKNIQPRGPYYIAGWSFGGTIAFEVSRQLESMNEEIDFLALIDSSPPYTEVPKSSREFEFNLQSELDFVKDYSLGSEIREKLKNVTDLNQFWLLIVEYLEINNYDIEIIKKTITEFGMQALPDYNQLNIKESIYYMNRGRTFHNARKWYTPPGKIHTPAHYFAANESKEIIDRKQWNQYTDTHVKMYEITGDHYSIFKMPNVKEFAELFDNILISMYQNVNIEWFKRPN